MQAMNQQRREAMTLPAESIPPLAEAVKSFRAALAVLEPWLEEQPPSLATNNLRRQIGIWRGVVTHAEQQVLAHEDV